MSEIEKGRVEEGDRDRAKRKKKIRARVWEKETERRKCGSTNGQIIYYSITHRRTPQWPMGKPRIPAPRAFSISLFRRS